MRTVRMALWIVVALTTLAMGTMVFWPKQETPTALPGGPFGGAFALIDHNGEAITEAAFHGKPTLVFFGFTHCPEVCPTTLYELNSWLEKVDPDGTRINAYFVTVDPERDVASTLKDYVTAISQRVVGITGDPAAVASMLQGYHVYSKKVPLDDGDYTMDHNASVFMLDSNRMFVGTISYGEDTENALAKLQRLIDSNSG